MPKRLEIYVIQPAFQGTEYAMATHSIDFEDESYVDSAVRSIVEALDRNIAQFYSGHRVSDVEEWRAAFYLPPNGASSPERESDS